MKPKDDLGEIRTRNVATDELSIDISDEVPARRLHYYSTDNIVLCPHFVEGCDFSIDEVLQMKLLLVHMDTISFIKVFLTTSLHFLQMFHIF